MSAKQVIQNYYEHFNGKNWNGMLELLHENLVHDVNEGQAESGRLAFTSFLQKMEAHYDEKLENIVVMTDEASGRGSAEFEVVGTYLKTDPGLPEARNQKYRIRAGGFFEVKNNQITRVTTYYNLKKWVDLVR